MIGACWSRALSADEIRSISANPWQVFSTSRPQPYGIAEIALGPYRPTGVISAGTWTPVNAANNAAAINEASPSTAEYITSPIAGSTQTVLDITPIPAGSQSINVQGRADSVATLTVELLDSANNVLATVTQALSSVYTIYNKPVTLSATATRVRIGVA